MDTGYTYNQYIKQVLSGEIITCELIKLAVKRHVSDLKKQKTKNFPYYFDEKIGQRYINFAQLCKHWKGAMANKFIQLEPWQQFYFVSQFGWQRMSGGRRFRSSYLEIARKNGKTTMCAVKALGMLMLDNEAGSQVYFAATKEEQAKIGFRDTVNIVKASPGLSEYFKCYAKSVVMGNSFIQPLGSDSEKQDGFDPTAGMIDEYHAHPTSHMLNVLESGMGSRPQPLIDIITTAGFNRQLPCYTEVRHTSIQILKGIMQDDTHFALIYTLDDKDDWREEENWIKSNPNIGVSVRLDFLRERKQKAINEGGSKEVDFKTKNLNIWTDAEKTWIPDEIWMKGKKKVDLDYFKDKECVIGLDLSTVRDLACLLLLFHEDEKYFAVPYFFCPEATAKERREIAGVKFAASYERWIKDGFIVATPGNSIDYDYIFNRVVEAKTNFKVKKIIYDPWRAEQLIPRFFDIGFGEDELIPMNQGYKSMSNPTKELEALAFNGQIIHGGNPVLRWMNGNVAISTDPAGNIKIDKKRSQEKVDGMISLVEAIDGFLKNTDTGSVYSERGILTI